MQKIALFGAGMYGKRALSVLRGEGKEVACFIDNAPQKWNTVVCGVPVMSLDDFLVKYDDYYIYICINEKLQDVIKKQLEDAGISNFQVFDIHKSFAWNNRESVISYSHKEDIEDVILYHVFRDFPNVFYIDVGCNDPVIASVTKLFYDKGASGINIDPLRESIKKCSSERPRDINLHMGLGASRGKREFFLQGIVSGEGSTMLREYCLGDNVKSEVVDIYPLFDVCEKYVGRSEDIHFLKIDVEGAEHQVLQGANFDIYRPWCIVMESALTLPGTDMLRHEEWEPFLLQKGYHLTCVHGSNRYYVANEHSELDERFIPVAALMKLYRIFHVELLN